MEAYVTIAKDDQFACGALVLAHSLKDVHTTRSLVCLVTPIVSSHVRWVCLYCHIYCLVLYQVGMFSLLHR